MSQIPSAAPTEVVDPVGFVKITYLGPVSPHWECTMEYGDPEQIQAFVDRIHARLNYITALDPQFRRNRERVKKDAEREQLRVEWIPAELGVDQERPERAESSPRR